MKKQFRGKKKGLDFIAEHLTGSEPNPNNRFQITIPNGGPIAVQGTGDFVSEILRQLLEHPESLGAAELIAGYNEMPAREQKRFRKYFKIGEFADPDQIIWPAWL